MEHVRDGSESDPEAHMKPEITLLDVMGRRLSKLEEQVESLSGLLEDLRGTIKRKDLEIELLKQIQSQGHASVAWDAHEARRGPSSEDRKANLHSGREPPTVGTPPSRDTLEVQSSDGELADPGGKKPRKLVAPEVASSATSHDRTCGSTASLAATLTLRSGSLCEVERSPSSAHLIDPFGIGGLSGKRARNRKGVKSKGFLLSRPKPDDVQDFMCFLNERKYRSPDRPQAVMDEFNMRCKSLVRQALHYGVKQQVTKSLPDSTKKLLIQIKVLNSEQEKKEALGKETPSVKPASLTDACYQ